VVYKEQIKWTGRQSYHVVSRFRYLESVIWIWFRKKTWW